VRGISAAVTLCFICGPVAMAQTPQATQGQSSPAAQAASMPTQQQQMMGYFAGDWKLAGTVKISPNSPGTPFTSTEHAEWVRAAFSRNPFFDEGPHGRRSWDPDDGIQRRRQGLYLQRL